jgi:DNA-binding transcriptional ArsR family regulator
VLSSIKQTPGLGFREIMRITGLSQAAVANHTRNLQDHGKLIMLKDGRATRFYPGDIPPEECLILAQLRNPTVIRIANFLMQNKDVTFREIVGIANRTPSTVSDHLAKLRHARLVTVDSRGSYKLYNIADRKRLTTTINKYLDKRNETSG